MPARANFEPLVLEGREPGGQLSTTTLVENFPGFVDGIDGPMLIMNMKSQAERFGARFRYSHVTGFEPKEGHRQRPDRRATDGSKPARSSSPAAPGPLARDRPRTRARRPRAHLLRHLRRRILPQRAGGVIGGGDSAAEEATFLTRFASKVYLVHRRDKLRASKSWPTARSRNPKIEPVWNTAITGLPRPTSKARCAP